MSSSTSKLARPRSAAAPPPATAQTRRIPAVSPRTSAAKDAAKVAKKPISRARTKTPPNTNPPKPPHRSMTSQTHTGLLKTTGMKVQMEEDHVIRTMILLWMGMDWCFVWRVPRISSLRFKQMNVDENDNCFAFCVFQLCGLFFASIELQQPFD
ncbi:hypothetical protein EJ03DRAFT_83425 [Teratosphaeria nubilosa]|uniref:Uncharacterized protein n=1 Tax=Teratosphaeria nubilosa TaxID=161662 RepID=A0A6G1LBN5_9PEZI|nr:hypothetical protein EJ03DRAFT_83425 [Teratosphaeria nubilosa]